LGWRGLYLLGAIPLVAAAPLRTRLRESRRWLEAKARGERLRRTPVRLVLAGAYRQRLLVVSGILFCFNFAVLSGAAYWTLFAREIRATALAVARSFSGTLGASAGLFLVPRLAAHRGLAGSYGNALALAGLALIPATILLNHLPETSGRELEDLAIDPG